MKNYSTNDTDEAAFIWSQKGVVYIRSIVTKERKRSTVTFHFECGDDVDIKTLQNEYYNETASVEPKRYIRKLNDIRSILFAELNSNKT